MLYNRVSTFEKPEHSNFFFSSSLSSPSLLFFSSFFLSFLSLLFSFLSLLRSAAAPTSSGKQARPNASGPGTTQTNRQAPTQARFGPVQAANPETFRGQLVRELSYSRQPRSVDDFLVYTRRLVAAVVVVTHELLEVDSKVRSSRNGLSKI